jgi:hypothetical protein
MPSWIDFDRFSTPARPLERLPSNLIARPSRSTAKYSASIANEIPQRLDVTGAIRVDQIECNGAVRRLCRIVSAISAEAIFHENSATVNLEWHDKILSNREWTLLIACEGHRG